jgi:cysteine-rich repeat protein
MRHLLLVLALGAGCADSPAPAVVDALPVDQLAPPALTLDATAVLPGQPLSFAVYGLGPGERAYVLRSSSISATGPCPGIIGGLCLDLRAPVAVLGSSLAGPSGVATLTLTVPAPVPVGLSVAFQAVAIRGLGGSASVKSQAVERETGAILPTPVEDLVVGDLVLTEVLHGPTAVPDADGEWFEVYNATAQTIDLEGLEVANLAGQTFSVGTSLVVAPGELVVLGARLDPAVNGGVDVDYAWSAFSLGSADAVVLRHGGLTLDAVAWDGGGAFPAPVGRSMSLDPAAWDEVTNDAGDAWCSAPVGIGSPGAVNDVCPVPACGDGALDPDEECDDGGLVLGDGCDDLCFLEGCPVLELLVGRWDAVGAAGTMSESARLSDGSVVIGGQLSTAGNSGAWFSAIDADGSAVTWSRNLSYISGVPLRALAAAPDGGTYVVGEYKAGGSIHDQTGVARLAADGTLLWKQYVGTATAGGINLYERPTHAVATSDGGLVVIGGVIDVSPSPAETLAMIKKVSSAGTLQWQQVWEHLGGGVGPPLANAVAELPGGSFFVGGDKPHLQSYSSNGTRLLELNGSGPLLVDDLAVTADGDLLMAARYGTNRSPQLLRITEGGATVWTRTINHTAPGSTTATRVAATPERCGAAVMDGGACPSDGDACATGSEVCTCDGSWSCEPGEQTFALAWRNTAGSNSVPSGTGAMWTTFDPDGVLLETRGLPGFSANSMAADDGGLVSIGWEGSTPTVVRTSATLDGVCDMVDYSGLSVSDWNNTFTAAVGPWAITVGPRVAAWTGGPAAEVSPTLSAVCTELFCP